MQNLPPRSRRLPLFKRKNQNTKHSISEQEDNHTWLRLDSSPGTYTELAHQLGLSEDWMFCDIFGLDAESLSFIPTPVMGLVLLFPFEVSKQRVSKARQKKEEEGEGGGSGISSTHQPFFVKQVVENCCGAISVIHCLANCQESLGISTESPLGKITRTLMNASPVERGNVVSRYQNIRDMNNQLVLERLRPTLALEGYVEKKTDISLIPLWKKRYFKLDGHKLYYWRTQEDSETSPPRKTINLLTTTRVIRRKKADQDEFFVQFRSGVANYFLRPYHSKDVDDFLFDDFKGWSETLMLSQQYWTLYYTVNPLPPGEPSILHRRKTQKTKKKSKLPQFGFSGRNPSCNHFICFVPIQNSDNSITIVELDGISQAPLFHGVTTRANFLNDCARVIQDQFLDNCRNDTMNFNLIGLVPAQN
jgi:hypothetical protein